MALVFAYVLPKLADYGSVWTAITSLSWWWILALVVSSAVYLLSNGLPWLTVLPGLAYFNALRMDLAGSGLSQVLPGGAAGNTATQVGMLKNWGFEGQPVALAVSLTTLANLFVTFGFPVIAIVMLSLDGDRARTYWPVALAGLVVLALLIAATVGTLRSAEFARRIGDWAARVVNRVRKTFHKQPMHWSGEDLVRFRGEAIELLRRHWRGLAVTTVANHLAKFVIFVVSLRALGVPRSDVDVIEAFAAWSFVRMLGSVSVTPANLGVEEVTLSGALVGFGGHNAEAVAATLVYRFLTVVPSVLLGLAAAATYNLRRPEATLRRPQTTS